MKFAMSYSGGKDSALALYRMIQKGHQPIALIMTVNKKTQRSWFHGIQPELMKEVSSSLGIPLIMCPCKPEDYSAAIEKGLAQAKQMGASACAFGDIDVEQHRKWDEDRCNAAGLTCMLPLWKQNREELTRQGLEEGFRALIKVVQLSVLDKTYLGKTLTWELAQRIKACGADLCGENGEYHTFVFDGPIFRFPIPVNPSKIVDFDTHAAVDIRLIKE